MRRVKIRELENGWALEDGEDRTEHPTAVEAFEAAQDASRERADAREDAGEAGVDVYLVEWETISRVGRCVALSFGAEGS